MDAIIAPRPRPAPASRRSVGRLPEARRAVDLSNRVPHRRIEGTLSIRAPRQGAAL